MEMRLQFGVILQVNLSNCQTVSSRAKQSINAVSRKRGWQYLIGLQLVASLIGNNNCLVVSPITNYLVRVSPIIAIIE